MSIWVDKDGRRHVGVMVEGKRIHRILPRNTSASDAKRYESEIRRAAGRRGVDVPGDPLLSKVMNLYVEHAKTLRSEQTALHHARRAGQWIEKYRASEARQAATAMIQDMTGHYAPATINRTLSALKKALSIAWDMNALPENYGAKIKLLPENNARDVTLSIEQIRSIADLCSPQVNAVIWTAIFTGCRRGEILALRRDDVRDDYILIRAGNTKTLKTRSVPIIAPLRPFLALVPFTVKFEGVKSAFRRAREKVGLPHVTFRDLRRSCGTMMIEKEVDLYVVSKLLGHSTVSVTQKHYAHMQMERMHAGLEKTFG